MKQIIFKFANPTYVNNKFSIDVVATSDSQLKIFGINLRFFYDTRIFKPGVNGGTMKLLLPDGYRSYNVNIGNSPTGWAAFGSTGALTYVNGAVELTNPAQAVTIDAAWTKILAIELESINPLSGTIYPSFIFDKKPDPAKGGFIGQSAGIVCTEYVKTDDANVMRTGQVIENVLHMNWSPNPTAIAYPWGVQTQNNGVTI